MLQTYIKSHQKVLSSETLKMALAVMFLFFLLIGASVQQHHIGNINSYNHYSIVLPSSASESSALIIQPRGSATNRVASILFPNYLHWFLNSIRSAATVTTYLIFNSTVTTTQVTTCIPSHLFEFDAKVTDSRSTQMCHARSSSADGELLHVDDHHRQNEQ